MTTSENVCLTGGGTWILGSPFGNKGVTVDCGTWTACAGRVTGRTEFNWACGVVIEDEGVLGRDVSNIIELSFSLHVLSFAPLLVSPRSNGGVSPRSNGGVKLPWLGPSCLPNKRPT